MAVVGDELQHTAQVALIKSFDKPACKHTTLYRCWREGDGNLGLLHFYFLGRPTAAPSSLRLSSA